MSFASLFWPFAASAFAALVASMMALVIRDGRLRVDQVMKPAMKIAHRVEVLGDLLAGVLVLVVDGQAPSPCRLRGR